MLYTTIAKYVGIVLLILTTLYLAHDKIYTAAYTKASIEYDNKIKEFNEKIRDRIDIIEMNSHTLIEQYSKGREQASKDYKNILAAARSKPLVIFQDGKCEITPDFSKAYLDALRRANTK